jgi:hypothetical protein
MSDLTGRTAGGSNSDESGEAGSAEEIDDDGLGEIVGGVPRQHVGRKTPVPQFAGSCFEIGPGFDVDAHCSKVGANIASGRGDSVGFIGRAGA